MRVSKSKSLCVDEHAGRRSYGVRLLLLCLGLALVVPLGGARPAAAAGRGEEPKIMTVLDASGSMKENDAGGQSRLAAAKSAVGRLLDGVPRDTAMGLRVYGSEYAGQAEGPGCRDTRLLARVGKLDAGARRAAKAKVRAVKAVGMTPIGATLRTAARDLGDEGPRRIILVSDGEDTCAPPSPCTVARELKGAGIDLVVDVVGFKVGAEARGELRCIARVTKGDYVDAGDADELADGLQRSARRALTPYDVSGTRTRGAESCDAAPRLEEGQYRDRFGFQAHRWYKARLSVGQRLRFSGAVVPRDGVYDTPAVVRLALFKPGESRRWESESSVESEWSNVISAGLESDRVEPEDLPDGAGKLEVCAQVLNRVRGTSGAQPVELSVDVVGKPRTADGSAPAPAVTGDGAGAGGAAHRADGEGGAGDDGAGDDNVLVAAATSPAVLSGAALVAAAATGLALYVLRNRRRRY